MNFISNILTLLILFLFFSCNQKKSDKEYVKWEHYLGDQGRSHYSSLDQISRENVKNLEVSWIYKTGDATSSSRIQSNPIIIGNTLFGISPGLKVFALDAATGEEKWSVKPLNQTHVSRGIMYWKEGEDERLFIGMGQYVVCLSPFDGSLIESFGNKGFLDLKLGLDRDLSTINLVATTPGGIYKDILVQGFLTSEGLPAAPGHIRGFDVRTGKQLWTFRTIPEPGEFGYDTWPKDAWVYAGGANNWSGLTIDEERGIVFVPTGSASFDFWGGNRKGDNLFANSLIALDIKTGKRLWHFQTVHHDIWDRDLPAPPNLVTVFKNGVEIEAVAQITKSGYVFLFDRETGVPIFDIIEKEYPISDLTDEMTSITQPFPVSPPPFSRQKIDVNDVNTFSKDKDSLINILKNVRSGGQFVPPSKEGTIIFPGFDGGAEWGGAGYDPETNRLYVNANEMPWILTMLERKDQQYNSLFQQGSAVYNSYCMSCHGTDKQGSVFHGNVMPLLGVRDRLSKDSIQGILRKGRNEMPNFSFLSNEEKAAVIGFLYNDTTSSPLSSFKNSSTIPYAHKGYIRFIDSEGYPAVKPPWGTLTSINLNEGTIDWQIPLGEIKELTDRGIPITGTENYGGPVITAGGLIFIAATKDKKIRAFDKENGKLLWSHSLPFDGMATPAMYEVDGKQYLVIGAGGGKISNERGDVFIAFSLKSL